MPGAAREILLHDPQDLAWRLEELRQRPDPDPRLGRGGAEKVEMGGLGRLQLGRALARLATGPSRRSVTSHAPLTTETCAFGSEAMKPAMAWLSAGPKSKHCRSPRVFQTRLVRNAAGL
jgi:hypothetical protein